MLNLALDATPEERARSLNLGVGFDRESDAWELIVKYSGSLLFLEEMGITVTELLNEYAVLVVPEPLIESLAAVPAPPATPLSSRMVSPFRVAASIVKRMTGFALEGPSP